jgi:ATP-dependent protease HslVU (ClpYQ) peptidase subunit
MTCIVYHVADETMAADTATFVHNGNTRMPGHVKKIWRLKDGSLMGHAGTRRQADLLKRWIEDGSNGNVPAPVDDVTALVVFPDGTMTVYDGKSERTVEGAPFYAIGSGADAALGALFAGATAKEAVEIASLVDPWTGDEVRVETLREVPRRTMATSGFCPTCGDVAHVGICPHFLKQGA